MVWQGAGVDMEFVAAVGVGVASWLGFGEGVRKAAGHLVVKRTIEMVVGYSDVDWAAVSMSNALAAGDTAAVLAV